jgi:hypothetical protein
MNSSIKTAVIAAIVAIVIGASSATAASMIGSSQVKDNSLTTKDIKNGTLSVADLSAAARASLKGNQGPAGPVGTQGPAGGFDPAKVTYVEGPEVSIAPGQTGNGVAVCPTGAKVLSGGWVVIAGAVGEVFGSRSYDSGGSWTVLVFNHGQYTNATVKPFAVCATR